MDSLLIIFSGLRIKNPDSYSMEKLRVGQGWQRFSARRCYRQM
jgi:hypothetical protein